MEFQSIDSSSLDFWSTECGNAAFGTLVSQGALDQAGVFESNSLPAIVSQDMEYDDIMDYERTMGDVGNSELTETRIIAFEHDAENDPAMQSNGYTTGDCSKYADIADTNDSQLPMPDKLCTRQMSAQRGAQYSNTVARGMVDDWEDYRPFIEQLYIEEKMKLKDVMLHLKTKFGFDATEKMYKTKIAQWGLHKNYKASEKEQLARVVKARRDTRRDISQLTIRNRPAKLDRVRRFCKQNRILEEICDSLAAAQSANGRDTANWVQTGANDSEARDPVVAIAVQNVTSLSSIPGPRLRKSLFDPARPLSTTSDQGRAELVLISTKTYIDWSASTIDIKAQQKSNFCYKAFECLFTGVRHIREGKSPLGWRLVRQGRDMLHQVMDDQPPDFLQYLLYFFGSYVFYINKDLQTNLLCFLAKLAALKCGCTHPISIILYHLQDQEQQIFTGSVYAAFELMIDRAESRYEDSESVRLQKYLCNLMMQLEDYSAAESSALRILRRSESADGYISPQLRQVLVDLGIVYLYQGYEEFAEEIFLDILQSEFAYEAKRTMDNVSIDAHEKLAKLYESWGDFCKCEMHWFMVLTGVLEVYEAEDTITLLCIAHIEKSFRNQGQDPQSWLQDYFGISIRDEEDQ